MSKQTEALKLALEGLEKWHFDKDPRGAADYIAAIREALAEQCVCGEPDTPGTHRTDGPCLAEQPAQQQEPVAWMVYTLDGNSVCVTDNPADFTPDHRALPLYTSPPASKPWVGLTDDEFGELWYRFNYMELMSAIEAKLREKNA